MNISPGPTRKRTHLKSSQVAILQESFANNPLPDSSVRSKLARELAVTERTIQIWFQNRRAKARKIESYGILKPSWMDQRHSTPPRYQATFRTMMTPERFEELKQQDNTSIRKRPRSSSKPEQPKQFLLQNTNTMGRAMSEGVYPVRNYPQQQQVLPVEEYQNIPFPVSVIRIGSWTRFAHITPFSQEKDWDLYCYCNPFMKEFVWRVQAEGHHFRIQIPFGDIHELRLKQEIQMETGDLVGQLEIELHQLPSTFSMWRLGQDHEWVRCGDFTEDKQASLDTIHVLQGNHESFKQSLLDLISLAPELAAKISVIPSNTHIDHFKSHSMSNLLMLQAPFIYNNNTNQHHDDIYQIMLQQQQQQLNSTPPPPSNQIEI